MRMRVATLNLFGLREDWPARREVLRAGFARLRPDLVSLQEVVRRGDYDQAVDVLGEDYHVAHHARRLPDGQGDSIASRWPIHTTHRFDVPARPPATGLLSSALAVEVAVPGSRGRVLLVNHPTAFALGQEAEREWQAAAVAAQIEAVLVAETAHVIVGGDMNAAPDATSMRFWTGRHALDGFSVCYRDAWAVHHPVDAGHTFTPENTLTTTGEHGLWASELGRRIDYILVRCTDYGPSLDVTASRRIFDTPVDGVWASDHFGVAADLSGPDS